MKPEPKETDKPPSEDLTTFEEIPGLAAEVFLRVDGSEMGTGRPPADVESQRMPLSAQTKQ